MQGLCWSVGDVSPAAEVFQRRASGQDGLCYNDFMFVHTMRVKIDGNNDSQSKSISTYIMFNQMSINPENASQLQGKMMLVQKLGSTINQVDDVFKANLVRVVFQQHQQEMTSFVCSVATKRRLRGLHGTLQQVPGNCPILIVG